MPYPLVYEPLVRAALLEDLGRADDLTTDTVVPADAKARARFVARHPGRVAGLTVSLSAFRLLDPGLSIEIAIPDGNDVSPGDTLAVARRTTYYPVYLLPSGRKRQVSHIENPHLVS